MNAIEHTPPTQEATLSVYYKDRGGLLHHMKAVIFKDPEGVTVEDVQRLHEQASRHLGNESLKLAVVQEDADYVKPILVVVQGGKA